MGDCCSSNISNHVFVVVLEVDFVFVWRMKIVVIVVDFFSSSCVEEIRDRKNAAGISFCLVQ